MQIGRDVSKDSGRQATASSSIMLLCPLWKHVQARLAGINEIMAANIIDVCIFSCKCCVRFSAVFLLDKLVDLCLGQLKLHCKINVAIIEK